MLDLLLFILLLLLSSSSSLSLHQYISVKRVRVKYQLHQTQQHDLKQINKSMRKNNYETRSNKKTLSKDYVEDIVVLSTETVFVIRHSLGTCARLLLMLL